MDLSRAWDRLGPRITVAALALLVPTVYFWIALVLAEGFGMRALFDSVFLPLDRDWAGKLVFFALMFGMPTIAALLTGADLLLGRLRGSRVPPVRFLILASSLFSMAVIVLHALTDR